jgi:hypothetical protein
MDWPGVGVSPDTLRPVGLRKGPHLMASLGIFRNYRNCRRGGRMWAERLHPGLQAERVKFEKAPGVNLWDKVLDPLTALSVDFPLYIVAGLDHRFG